MTTDTSPEQVAYDALVELVASRPGDLDFAVLVASFAVEAGIETGMGCDGCDRVMVPDLLDEFGGWSTAYDSNGDPDVSICPVCVHEYDPEIEAVGFDELEAKIRDEESQVNGG